MTWTAYRFEAKSIQAYIMGSGRLRDLVGASELVDSLCSLPLDNTPPGKLAAPVRGDAASKVHRSLLNDALLALGAADGAVYFSRCAGGAFYAFSQDADVLQRLRSFWPLVVAQYAPGLAFDHGLGAGATPFAADAAARKAQQANRSQVRPDLPQAGPRVHRSQRTGRPAVKVRTFAGGDVELLDATTARQRRFAQPDRMGLIQRLTPDGEHLTWRHWPLDLTPNEARRATDDEEPEARLMPFLGDARVIGVLHADGNGLGELLHRLGGQIKEKTPERLIEVFSALSTGLQRATEEAAKAAVKAVLIPARDRATQLLPARPVVLGGDDLTMILRADVALPFAQVFLTEFAARTAPVMDEVRHLADCGDEVVPPRLTACAGIAYLKASQPFYLGAELAEGITKLVKQQAKAFDERMPPTSLAFHRVTTAMIDDYAEVLKRELSTAGPDGRWCHSLGAYGLDAEGPLPPLKALLDLQRLLENPAMARGPARQVLTLIADSPEQAEVRWRRWRTLMADPRTGRPSDLQRLDAGLGALINAAARPGAEWSPKTLPYRRLDGAEAKRLGDAVKAGPLGDLHALSAVGNDTRLPAREPADAAEEVCP